LVADVGHGQLAVVTWMITLRLDYLDYPISVSTLGFVLSGPLSGTSQYGGVIAPRGRRTAGRVQREVQHTFVVVYGPDADVGAADAGTAVDFDVAAAEDVAAVAP